jgi:hypothetical protein
MIKPWEKVTIERHLDWEIRSKFRNEMQFSEMRKRDILVIKKVYPN